MKFWKYLGGILMFRWLFGHQNRSHDCRDLDASPYNPPRRTTNRYTNRDYLHRNTPLDSYDSNQIADNDFLDDLDDLDHFDDF